MHFFCDPLGSGISKYDLSTPKAALVSQMKMQLNTDIRAVLELESRLKGRTLKEAISTLDVRKEAEYRGRKLLFVSFKEDGVTKHKVEAFTKDANTGFWIPDYVGEYEVEKDDKDLAAQMRRWKERGDL